MRAKALSSLVAGCMALGGIPQLWADIVHISGLQPDRRPAWAPVIKQYVKPEGWYTCALRGVDKPYPASLRFLEDQGTWYTPFNHKGMYPPYDLRKLHLLCQCR